LQNNSQSYRRKYFLSRGSQKYFFDPKAASPISLPARDCEGSSTVFRGAVASNDAQRKRPGGRWHNPALRTAVILKRNRAANEFFCDKM
jgi:hypothetical protein